MDLIKKYWVLFIIGIIFIAVILNFILIIPAFTPIVGDNRDWLLFFGSIIGAAASFAMVFFTAKTLKQNEEQLNELKRQWDEEHSPYLSAQLIAQSYHFNLRIFNSSRVTADNISLKIRSFLDKEEILQFDELQSFLDNQFFTIPPMESIYFPIFITPFRELENLPKGYIEICLKSNNKDFGTLHLYPSDYAFVSYGEKDSPIVNSLDKIADKIKDQRVYLK